MAPCLTAGMVKKVEMDYQQTKYVSKCSGVDCRIRLYTWESFQMFIWKHVVKSVIVWGFLSCQGQGENSSSVLGSLLPQLQLLAGKKTVRAHPYRLFHLLVK